MQHIWFIMDGNRTWAKSRLLPSFEGHRRGYANFKNIIESCIKRDLKYISFWALSDDNIRERSSEEVNYLFDLLWEGMNELINEAHKWKSKVRIIWDRTLIRSDCLTQIEKIENETKIYDSFYVIIGIGYGGREEISRAVVSLARTGHNMLEVTTADILRHLETWEFPQIDMIVRTWGHLRHSWFYLYQSPYAEYYFSSKNWPDFAEEDIDIILESFSNRNRKFWK